MTPPDETLAQFERTGRMDWVTDLAEIPAKHGVTNVYAELGTSFASSVVTHPRHCAALLGTLVAGWAPTTCSGAPTRSGTARRSGRSRRSAASRFPSDMQRAPRLRAARAGRRRGQARASSARTRRGSTASTCGARSRPSVLAGDGIAAVRAAVSRRRASARSNLAYGFVRGASEGGGIVASDLDGKAVLVTGGGSGIGRATALALRARGRAARPRRRRRRGRGDGARGARARRGGGTSCARDVARQPTSRRWSRARSRATAGSTAPSTTPGSRARCATTADYPEETFERVIAGEPDRRLALPARRAAAHARAGGGAIVNTASVAGLVGAGGSRPTSRASTASSGSPSARGARVRAAPASA